MKMQLNRRAGCPSFSLCAPLSVALLLLASLEARGDTPYTGTGWVTGFPVLPIVCTNGAGHVLIRANVQTLRVECTDTRLTSRRTVFTDGYYQADGSAVVYGTGYAEVGAWAGTDFTPNGGIWEINWRGAIQTDYSFQLSLAGYGSGGTIDGWRMEETLTRGPGAGPIDPTVPSQHTGTLRPPPVSATLFADDFDGGIQDWSIVKLAGTVTLNGTNGQFVTRADWTGEPGDMTKNTFFAFAPSGTWSPTDGQTLQCQVDLVSISQTATNEAMVWAGTGSDFYAFSVTPRTVYLEKWTASQGLTVFWLDNTVQLPGANVVLCLALTRDQANLILTTRVLDKNNQNAILFERSFVDTPQVDPSLSTAQFSALTDITTIGLVPTRDRPSFPAKKKGSASSSSPRGTNPQSRPFSTTSPCASMMCRRSALPERCSSRGPLLPE